MSYTFVNKMKIFVDTNVDTAALEPRGFQPCQRCQRKNRHTLVCARHKAGVRVHVYIYILFTYYYYYYIPQLARVSVSTSSSTKSQKIVDKRATY